MTLDTRLSIETPESVRVEYPLADVGSRAVALAADFLLQYVVLGVAFIIVTRLGAPLPQGKSVAWVVAILAFNWLYFVAFELALGGQTPGKRLVGLRVVQANGDPATWRAVLTRNLLRIVDMLPGTYGVALVVAFCERKHRRLGDLVAGTIVVRERKAPLDRTSTALRRGAPDPAWSDAALALHLDEATRALVRDYLTRRAQLDPGPLAQVRAEIVETVLDRAAAPELRGALVARLGAAHQDAFLETVASA